MLTFLIAIICLHVIASMFWAGTTFTLARNGVLGGETLFRPQVGAATVVVLTGATLWHFWHRGGFGTQETILALGASAALMAIGVQVGLRRKPQIAQRAAALLLVTAAVAMVSSRFIA